MPTNSTFRKGSKRYVAFRAIPSIEVTVASPQTLDHVTDVIVFGALAPCEKCKNGNFVLGNSAYLCTGDLTEWAKCDNVAKEPKRVAVKIPKSIQKDYSFLNKKFKAQTRALKDIAPVLVNRTKVKKEGDEDIEQ